jgi:WD40 repeat protein
MKTEYFWEPILACSFITRHLYELVTCFSEHIAPVLSLTPALNNSVIVSGGEDSRIIITSLLTGDVVMKIDHHRGPVMSVKVNTAGDVLVSGPPDILVLLSFSFFRTFRLSNSVELFYFLLFLAFPTILLV